MPNRNSRNRDRTETLRRREIRRVKYRATELTERAAR